MRQKKIAPQSFEWLMEKRRSERLALIKHLKQCGMSFSDIRAALKIVNHIEKWAAQAEEDARI